MDQPHGTEKAVCEDIAKRQEFGMNKYGQSVADNPLSQKQWLQHAYEECLDQSVYLKRLIEEMDNEHDESLPIKLLGREDEMLTCKTSEKTSETIFASCPEQASDFYKLYNNYTWANMDIIRELLCDYKKTWKSKHGEDN